jgi:hypothetical protein
MLFKISFALGFLAVTIVGSALPFLEKTESDVMTLSDTNINLSPTRESGTIPHRRMHGVSKKLIAVLLTTLPL